MKRKTWREQTFDFESASILDPDGESFGLIRVTLDLYRERGGLVMTERPFSIELLAGPGEIVARDLTLEDFSPEDQEKIESLVERRLNEVSDDLETVGGE